MPEFRIFTESKADIRFIRDYILEHFEVELSETTDFDNLEGYSGYKKGGVLKKSIQQNHDNGKETILILDANGNIEQRHNDVLIDFRGYGIAVHLFLFPNNVAAGCLENMLYEIATDRKIFRCFEEYENCIAEYQIPSIKDKIFAYLDAQLPAVNKKKDKNDLIQEANRNYRNTTHWNLHHEYLQPLHDFLSPFFNP